VDHIYCVNLERRPDRLVEVRTEFDRVGLHEVEVFRATDGRAEAPDNLLISEPEWGCADSHIRIWRDVVQNGYDTALVFEDDCRLPDDFKTRLEQVLEDLKSVPDWDYVNLGPGEFRRDNWIASARLTRGAAYSTHCYLVSLRGAQKMGVWDSVDLQLAVDAQIARSPLKMYYCPEPLASQCTATSGVLGLVQSAFQGDLGLERTIDIDFFVRTTWEWFALGIFIMAIVFLLKRLAP
jgi:GR25 family glycosyltransferase involved in LPS biosynthesis